MGPFEALSNLAADIARLFEREGTFGYPFGQRLAFDKLQDKKALPVSLFNSIDGGNIWVIERGEDFGFTLKPGQPLAVYGEDIGQHFDGHLSAEADILGPINFAHPTGAEFAKDPVFCGNESSIF
jgi:hypothetical protein